MTDLKKYAGKQVHVQLRAPWILVGPPEDDGPPGLLLPPAEMLPPGESAQPQIMPCIAGEVRDDGALLMTKNDGVIAIELHPEVIHSVAEVVKKAEPRLVHPVGNGGSVLGL